MTAHPRSHGSGAGDGGSTHGGHEEEGGGTPRLHGGGAGSAAELTSSISSAFDSGRASPHGGTAQDSATPADTDNNTSGSTTPHHAVDPEEARVYDTYNKLGDEPPEFDIAANDAAHGSHGAHSDERHGSTVPLHRDPDPQSGNRTVEGRIYGDSPWDRPENYSYRWSDPGTMNRTVNAYVRDNWESIRTDLAFDGKHQGKVVTGNAVGEGYFNRGMYGAGPRAATYGVTSTAVVRIKLVEGSDPPIPFIVTTYPSGT